MAPAWRPLGARHELAFAVPGVVRILSTDGRAAGARVPTAPPLALSWRADGRVLAVIDSAGATLYSAAGKRLRRIPVRGGSALDGGFAPGGDRLVILRRDLSGGTTLLVRGTSGPLRPVRHLLLTAVGDLRFSPDGTSALVASREGDEWIDIRLRDGRQMRLRRVGERLRAGLMPRALAWAG